MAQKQSRHRSHPDFRHRSQIPMPAIEDVEQRLFDVLSPSLLAPRSWSATIPAAAAGDSHAATALDAARAGGDHCQPGVAAESRRGRGATRVGARRAVVGAPALGQPPSHHETARCGASGGDGPAVCRLDPPPGPGAAPLPQPHWAPVRERFPLLAIVDGSTLEALRKKAKALQEQQGLVLAGKVLVMVEAFSHRPLWQHYTEDALANDKRGAGEILAALPPGGLLVFALGFFSFLWFDAFTETAKYFVTRLREKTAYRTVQVLSSSPYYRDEIIQLGQYRANPCQHPLRLVSVLWHGTWYRYLTNVLAPHWLSARQVCELYRRRWRIEDAFALTKRLLDLAYVWTGSRNGVQLRIDATLLFYAVLLTICQQVAQALGEPLERISVKMVFRAFYHYSRAVQRGESDNVIQFLTEHAKLLGIVKRQRTAHRERQQLELMIWGDP